MGKTPIVSIDPRSPDPGILKMAARLLDEDKIVAGPSDTVYGFLALPGRPEARRRLDLLKDRSGPYIVLVATWEQARSLTRDVTKDTWERLGEIWPGPTTVILPANPKITDMGEHGIAIRMPGFKFLDQMIRVVGKPLFSTSANRRGDPPPVRAKDIPHHSDLGPALILDGGTADSRISSSIVDLTEETPRVIREGRGNLAPLLDQKQTGF